jgi:hypothetical protein
MSFAGVYLDASIGAWPPRRPWQPRSETGTANVDTGHTTQTNTISLDAANAACCIAFGIQQPATLRLYVALHSVAHENVVPL